MHVFVWWSDDAIVERDVRLVSEAGFGWIKQNVGWRDVEKYEGLEPKDWDWALDQIAAKIKATRDDNWIARDQDGHLVNRTEAIATVGGSAHSNEECYALVKALRALGLVYIETQARI